MGAEARLTVVTRDADPRAAALVADAQHLGIPSLTAVRVADVVHVRGELSADHRSQLTAVLVDPLLQEGTWDVPAAPPDVAAVVESAPLPGVTDTAGHEVVGVAARLGIPVTAATIGTRYELVGDLGPDDIEHLVRGLLVNPVVERAATGVLADPFPAVVHEVPPVERIHLPADDDGLLALSSARSLALDLHQMRAVAVHFTALGRDPTDAELETIAQTWSEHCAHTTFRAAITTDDGREVTPLLRQLRASTDAIAAPFVVSAFVGNAGILRFDDERTLAVKMETHNHPSAIEPFGGANTGVGGVIRDVLGTAHRPIAATDVLCFGPLDTDPDALPSGVLHPLRIHEGVVAGVADYGNKIGLPTVAGAVLFHPAYTANPLVFCGCIGEAPLRDPLPGPRPGDRVVAIGGRTGRDGIRGATFSSLTMDASTGDVAGASVQIGDPITERLVLDVLRDADGLFTAITDCGAGGFSSAVGEMAEGVGAAVDLRQAPLKYQGLAPWEIWLSEAQERMVLAVPPERLDALRARCDHHGVELADLGWFTGDGRLVVTHGAEVVVDLDTGFLHDGQPQRRLRAEMPRPVRGSGAVPAVPAVGDPAARADLVLALLAHPTIASKAHIVHRYDHEILGATVVRPCTGACDDGPADGVVIAAPTALDGLAVGHGVNPWFGELDAEHMAWACVDEAVRNVVAAGGDPTRVALMDNFSWGDPRRPSTLGQLVAAVEGCCAAARAYGAPFVSGKDSLNNEYLGADGERHAVPPTLVITAIAPVPGVATVTPDLKAVGDVLVLCGRTEPELGGSHLVEVLGGAAAGFRGDVPAPDPEAPARYRAVHAAIQRGLVRAAHDCSEGGLAVAVAEMVVGGRMGARLETTGHDDVVVGLFSESVGRLVLEVDPRHVDEVLATVPTARVVGVVTGGDMLELPGTSPLPLGSLVHAWSSLAGAGGPP